MECDGQNVTDAMECEQWDVSNIPKVDLPCSPRQVCQGYLPMQFLLLSTQHNDPETVIQGYIA